LNILYIIYIENTAKNIKNKNIILFPDIFLII